MAGLWSEDFEVGMVVNHDWPRTITEADDRRLPLLTMNAAAGACRRPCRRPLGLEAAAGHRPVHPWMHGRDECERHPLRHRRGQPGDVRPALSPLFEGDTIRGRTTVPARRESASRPGEGIVTLRHECFNQDSVPCGICDCATLRMKRPEAAA